ncbi:TonB family protein [Oceanicoccus sagamiensis]|uniref:TonB C-terminal domain-containing protein n=1 Tax=Oceanicoccus sagamiensis TaxID=716816 RepID=A0A1X9NGZ6_9GAMM|nr:TonB family protein [Oceanicoccus sagamiensis]ARN74779.1 hypothetical protein BST96_12005 [Oceanicoccus sagamiensis]
MTKLFVHLLTDRLSQTYKALALIAALAACAFSPAAVQAQDDSFDELPLNGLAAYVQLRKEYYIGGLYLESLSQDSSSTFNFSGRKRMEMRITIDKWSPRRFAQQWNQLILINNDQESLDEFADQILAFIDMPKDDLIAGDRITIDLDPERGTTVYLNGSKAFSERNNAFFDILLNTWIGQRPPSSDFKNDILTLPTDAEGTELLTRYENQSTDQAREKKVAAWFKSSKSSSKAAASKPATQSASVAPPSSDTAVTAKRSSKAAPVAVAIAAPVAIAQPKVAAPATNIELAKPTLDSSASPAPAPKAAEPKAEPKPEPKPQPKPAKAEEKVAAAKPAPAKAEPSAEDAEQAKLMKEYRSTVLKLTYLNTQYPKRAMDFKQEGLVVVKITVRRDGKLVDLTETTKSKHKLLNNAARKAVKKTAPYPEVPKGLKGDVIEVSMPFNFKL